MDYEAKWGKRNWKGIQADYDAVIINPVNTDGCCYCLEQNQVELLLAALTVYHWTTRWTNGDIEQETIDDFVNRLEKTLMSGCGCAGETPDGSAPEYRYTVINNTYYYQVSYDDGVTWVTAPDYPPAIAPAMPPPVGETVDTKCDAAANGLQHIQDLVDRHTAAYDTAGTVAEFILIVAAGMLVLIFAPEAVPLIIPIIFGAAQAAFSIGKTAWESYWTTEVYDAIQCALFCNISEDGTFSEAGFAGFMSDIGSDLPPGVPRDMIYRDFQVWGAKGLSTVCAYGIINSGSDCSGCDCGTCDIEDWVYATVDGEPDGAFDGDISVFSDTTLRLTTGTQNESNLQYYVAIKKQTGCCKLVSTTIVSGGASNLLYMTECPNDNNVEYSHITTTPADEDHCIWCFVGIFGEPTVIDVTFGACDEE